MVASGSYMNRWEPRCSPLGPQQEAFQPGDHHLLSAAHHRTSFGHIAFILPTPHLRCLQDVHYHFNSFCLFTKKLFDIMHSEGWEKFVLRIRSITTYRIMIQGICMTTDGSLPLSGCFDFKHVTYWLVVQFCIHMCFLGFAQN